MKAIVCTKYGSPEVLKIKEIPKPVPKANEVMIKIFATAVNSGDVRVRALATTGILKIIMRFVLGFFKPRKAVLGTAFSGIVEEVGAKATYYKKGDKVFGATGFKFGTYAEYLIITNKTIATKMPANADFEQAAALPFGGQTAISFLHKAKIKEKQNMAILIYGATGAVGAAAIQIAKYYKANVTAVCSSAGKAFAQKLQANDIILYDKEDFTKTQKKFDIVFDAVGKTSKKQCGNLLAKDGIFVTVGGLDVAAERKEQLELIRQLYERGQYSATIDKIFSFNDMVNAHKYVDTGRKKGNVVVKIVE